MAYKVYYWPKLGRGDQVRLLLEVVGAAYENVELTGEPTGDQVKWPEWAQDNRDKCPFAFVPVLEHDGFFLSQGPVILSYIAKVEGLYPKDLRAGAVADSVAATAEDLRGAYFASFASTDNLTPFVREKWEGRFAPGFESILEANGSGYFAGDALSHADIAVFDVLWVCLKWREGFRVDVGPNLKAWYERLLAHDKIKAYIESDQRPTS